MRYGYARVSTRDQCVDRQLAALQVAEIPREKIFIDYASGKDFARKNYRKLLGKLRFGDELFISSIDRLGRNYEEILSQWNRITKEKAVHVVVLDCPLLDTRNTKQGLTGKLLADLVLQILSYVAQVERENIRERQKEGIREAKRRGVVFGRPSLAIPEAFPRVAQAWQREEISLREGAGLLGVSHTTFSKWLKAGKIAKIAP